MDIKNLYYDIIPEKLKIKFMEWVYLIVETSNSTNIKSKIHIILKSAHDLIPQTNEYSGNTKQINAHTKTEIIKFLGQSIADKGFECKNDGDIKGALIYFERILGLNIFIIESLKAISDCYYELHLYNEAIGYLKKVIQISPNNHEAYYNLSINFSELNDYEKAREYGEHAVKLKPRNPDYLYNLGIVFADNGNYFEAIKLFLKADQLNPYRHDIMRALALSYVDTNQIEKAIKILERMTLIFPKESFSFSQLGEIYGNNKLYNKGLDYFKIALDLDPDDPINYYNIAVLYARMDEDNLVVDIYMKALLRNPKLTVDLWESCNFLLDLNISTEFKYEILSFGAEYGDTKAKQLLENNLWLNDYEDE